jgi:hypothetical protein
MANVRIRTHAPGGLVCFSRLELLAQAFIPKRYLALTLKNLIIE